MRKIVITGPGRSGTTLLVQLLDRLGFDAGVGRLGVHSSVRAGLESNLLADDAPQIIKDPWLTWRLPHLLDQGIILAEGIDMVLVPIRSLDQVAASRIENAARARDVNARGALMGTTNPRQQAAALASGIFGLIEALARHEVPVLFIAYPRFATDPGYAFRTLSPILGDCDEQRFRGAWQEVVVPTLVREKVTVPRFSAITLAEARMRRWLRLKRSGLARRLSRG